MLAITLVALAATLNINISQSRDTSTVNDSATDRIAYGGHALGIAVTNYGLTGVNSGDTLRVTYGDGSKESFRVNCTFATNPGCVSIKPGTQVQPGGGSGGGGGVGSGGGGSGYGNGGGGFTWTTWSCGYAWVGSHSTYSCTVTHHYIP